MICCLSAILFSAPAAADTLQSEGQAKSASQGNGANKTSPIEELSHEWIVDPRDGHNAQLRLRVALHNPSSQAQDFVYTIALPRHSQLTDSRAAQNGNWVTATQTSVPQLSNEQVQRFEQIRTAGDYDSNSTTGVPVYKLDPENEERREPGTIYVVPFSPQGNFALPSAQVIGYSIESGTTVEVELTLNTSPSLKGDRWEIDMPRRELRAPNITRDRRVVFANLEPGEVFYIDGASNMGAPFVSTRAEDDISVSWSADRNSEALLSGSYRWSRGETISGGQFHTSLRLGHSPRMQPDHIVVLVDRSGSVTPELQRNTVHLLAKLSEELPSSVTYHAIGFSRTASSLMDKHDLRPTLADAASRKRLAAKLARERRFPGTNLPAAFEQANKHLKALRSSQSSPKNPLVLIVTDGALPSSETISPKLRKQLRKSAGVQPEILFIVDDPILANYGLPPGHPLLDATSNLEARMSLRSLGAVQHEGVAQLLAAPYVVHDLKIATGRRMKLNESAPSGLAAGQATVLTGSFKGKRPPRNFVVRGVAGGKNVRATLRSQQIAQTPTALVIPLEETLLQATQKRKTTPQVAIVPPWYRPAMHRDAFRTIDQAGRGGYEMRGHLDKDLIGRYLQTGVRPRVRACYNTALGRDPSQAGKVVIHIELGKGEIMTASLNETELTVQDTHFSQCLVDAAWSLNVPRGKLDGHSYIVHYPVTFSSPDGERAVAISDEDRMWIGSLLQRADTVAGQ